MYTKLNECNVSVTQQPLPYWNWVTAIDKQFMNFTFCRREPCWPRWASLPSSRPFASLKKCASDPDCRRSCRRSSGRPCGSAWLWFVARTFASPRAVAGWGRPETSAGRRRKRALWSRGSRRWSKTRPFPCKIEMRLRLGASKIPLNVMNSRLLLFRHVIVVIQEFYCTIIQDITINLTIKMNI